MNDENIINLLKRVEWCGTADFQFYTVKKCPICGGLKEDTKINSRQIIKAGHKSDCELEKAIVEFNKEYDSNQTNHTTNHR